MIRGLAVLFFFVAAAARAGAFTQTAVAPPPPTAASGAEKPAAPGTPQSTPPAGAPVAAPPPAGPAAGLAPVDARLEPYEQFRALFETGRYAEALPFAQRVVELAGADPERDHELPIAYNNLAATQLRLNDYAAAEANYRQSLELLESTQGISSRRLIVPLAGLGAVYAGLDQHQIAAELFDRALAVSRRADGLFNLDQLPLIEEAAASRFAIGDFVGVGRERQYALRILEQNYGYGDVRTLPAALKLAEFYESLQEFPAARSMYLRVRDVAMKESGGYNVAAVRAMISICRTHRLQFAMDPDSLDGDEPERDPITGQSTGALYRSPRIVAPEADRAGLKSAEQAVAILRAAVDPPKDLFAEALTELADWYQTTARPALALPLYAEAAALYESGAFTGKGNPLGAPRMIYYRAPLYSRRDEGVKLEEGTLRSTVFSFLVTETGLTDNIQVVSTDMAEGQVSQSRRALSRAIYSPRILNGKAVATPDVRFTSDWFQHELPPDPPPSTTPDAAPEPAPTPTPVSEPTAPSAG